MIWLSPEPVIHSPSLRFPPAAPRPPPKPLFQSLHGPHPVVPHQEPLAQARSSCLTSPPSAFASTGPHVNSAFSLPPPPSLRDERCSWTQSFFISFSELCLQLKRRPPPVPIGLYETMTGAFSHLKHSGSLLHSHSNSGQTAHQNTEPLSLGAMGSYKTRSSLDPHPVGAQG